MKRLEPLADDPDFQSEWRKVKEQNKRDLAELLLARCHVQVDVRSIFDVLVKRLHEYKRQLLKTLHIIWLYHRLKAEPQQEIVPRTFIFGAKAAPGYFLAKRIIKLIHCVAEVVNGDPDVGGRMKVVFPANFNVSLAETHLPGSGYLGTDLLGGQGSLGDRQHEIRTRTAP